MGTGSGPGRVLCSLTSEYGQNLMIYSAIGVSILSMIYADLFVSGHKSKRPRKGSREWHRAVTPERERLAHVWFKRSKYWTGKKANRAGLKIMPVANFLCFKATRVIAQDIAKQHDLTLNQVERILGLPGLKPKRRCLKRDPSWSTVFKLALVLKECPEEVQRHVRGDVFQIPIK